MSNISPSDIKRLADKLSISRAVFQAAYDEMAVLYDSTPFKVIAQMANHETNLDTGTARDRRDYFTAMKKANDGGWLVDFVFEKFTDLAASEPEPVTPIAPEPDTNTLRGVLQSIANRQQRFEDARTITMRTLTAMRRCCIIRSRRKTTDGVEEEAEGSGFLIGPHLVLTNYHVISKFLDANNEPDDAKPTPFVEFDFHAGNSTIIRPKRYDVQQDPTRSWLLTHSPNIPAADPENEAAFAVNLDYAVLVLNRRPGDMRGFYDLNFLPPNLPAVNTPVQLWQFPQRQPMSVVTNNRAPAPLRTGIDDAADTAPRIYYLANALPGSSGGLVLDNGSEPIALHDAGFDAAAPPDDRKNRGVPLVQIAHHALTHINTELNDQPPKTGWHPRLKLPIIGRQTLQKHIYDAAYKHGRIIAVMTIADENLERIPKLGRSYTREIIESCLPPEQHHVLSIEASLIDPDPFVTAARIVSVINPDLAANLPLPTGETTLDADATGLLVQATVSALEQAAPGKTVWLMIDDIDSDPIGTQWGASSYLVALYRRIAREDKLRVVLAGLPRRLEGLDGLRQETGILLEDHLDQEPSDEERTEWIAAHLTHQTMPDELAPRLSALVSTMAIEDMDRANGMAGDTSNTGQSRLSKTEAINWLLRIHARAAFLDGGGND